MSHDSGILIFGGDTYVGAHIGLELVRRGFVVHAANIEDHSAANVPPMLGGTKLAGYVSIGAYV